MCARVCALKGRLHESRRVAKTRWKNAGKMPALPSQKITQRRRGRGGTLRSGSLRRGGAAFRPRFSSVNSGDLMVSVREHLYGRPVYFRAFRLVGWLASPSGLYSPGRFAKFRLRDTNLAALSERTDVSNCERSGNQQFSNDCPNTGRGRSKQATASAAGSTRDGERRADGGRKR